MPITNGFHPTNPSQPLEESLQSPSASSEFPITDSDDGHPSDDLHADLLRVLQLIHSERHLVALNLFLSVEDRLKDVPLDDDRSIESLDCNREGSITASPTTRRRNLVHRNTQSRHKKNTSEDVDQDNHRSYRQRIKARKLLGENKEEFDVLKVCHIINP